MKNNVNALYNRSNIQKVGKCFVAFLLSLMLIILSSNGALAYDDDEIHTFEEFRYVIQDDQTAKIISVIGWPEGHISIPDEVDGVTVTAIGENAFGWEHFKELTIPDTVVIIEGNPFSNELDTIHISPNNPTFQTIDGLLYSKTEKKLVWCPNNRWSVEIPEGIEIIGDKAFMGCDGLEQVSLPDSIIEIGINPFLYCTSLYDIQVSRDHKSLAIIDGLLYSKPDKRLVFCPAYYSEVEIPEGIQIIGESAFEMCDSIYQISLPNSLSVIEAKAFDRCSCLESITIPGGVYKVGDDAFSQCENLRSVILQEGVKEIGDMTFYECENLSELILPNSLEYIDHEAFAYCYALTEIDIPENVYYIGYVAFWWCTGLERVSIPKGVTSIKGDTFLNCKGLSEVYIPDGVESIGSTAFCNCDALSKINIPQTVTYIEDDAFDGCPLLVVTVERDSYAEQFCQNKGIEYMYTDSLDWLNS